MKKYLLLLSCILFFTSCTSVDNRLNIENVEDMTNITQAIVEFNSKVWNEKKQNDLSLKDSIKIEIPENLDQFRKDLIAMHNLETN